MTGTSAFLRQERADPVRRRTGAERWRRNSLIWRNSGPDLLYIPRKISGRIFTPITRAKVRGAFGGRVGPSGCSRLVCDLAVWHHPWRHAGVLLTLIQLVLELRRSPL